MDGLAALRALKVLILSFNDLSKMETIQDLPLLETLDLSHNTIRKVDGLRGMSQLTNLQLNNNLIHKMEDINVIKRCVVRRRARVCSGGAGGWAEVAGRGGVKSDRVVGVGVASAPGAPSLPPPSPPGGCAALPAVPVPRGFAVPSPGLAFWIVTEKGCSQCHQSRRSNALAARLAGHHCQRMLTCQGSPETTETTEQDFPALPPARSAQKRMETQWTAGSGNTVLPSICRVQPGGMPPQNTAGRASNRK